MEGLPTDVGDAFQDLMEKSSAVLRKDWHRDHLLAVREIEHVHHRLGYWGEELGEIQTEL